VVVVVVVLVEVPGLRAHQCMSAPPAASPSPITTPPFSPRGGTCLQTECAQTKERAGRVIPRHLLPEQREKRALKSPLHPHSSFLERLLPY
jgi:hypothetical protein